MAALLILLRKITMNRLEAEKKAREIMERTNQLMKLENQEVADEEGQEWLFQRLVEHILTLNKEIQQ
jgi:hypothetical protein